MYHTVANSFTESSNSFCYLKWSSDDIEDEIIKPEYFYLKSVQPPAKAMDFDPT